jgi:hypothetical protein
VKFQAVATPYRSTLLKASRETSRSNPHDKFLSYSSLTRVTGKWIDSPMKEKRYEKNDTYLNHVSDRGDR